MRCVAVLLLICISTIAQASEDMKFTILSNESFTGEALWNDYRDRDRRPMARSYIIGVAHAANEIAADYEGINGKRCIPAVLSQPGGPDSVVTVVARYLADNPGERAKHSAAVVLAALRASYPCTG